MVCICYFYTFRDIYNNNFGLTELKQTVRYVSFFFQVFSPTYLCYTCLLILDVNLCIVFRRYYITRGKKTTTYVSSISSQTKFGTRPEDENELNYLYSSSPHHSMKYISLLPFGLSNIF